MSDEGAALAKVAHPIDRAIDAISEAIGLLLVGSKRSRFSEIQSLTSIAYSLQRLRPAEGVDDAMAQDDEGDGNGIWLANGPAVVNMPNVNPVGGRRARFNDAVDLNREIIMLAQGFLKNYQDIEKQKASKPAIDTQLQTVVELSSLMELRIKLMAASQEVPEDIHDRITHLLKKLGGKSDAAEHESDPAISAEPVRGREADGAGGQDGDRVGEPVANGA